MEDIAVYCSWADSRLSEGPPFLSGLPAELRSLILQSDGPRYLDSLAQASRLPQCTDTLVPLFMPLLPELAARWCHLANLNSLDAQILTLASLARVLPCAPSLRLHVRCILDAERFQSFLRSEFGGPSLATDEEIHALLLALFRLLSHDRDILSTAIGPAFFSQFLRHDSLDVRYLSIQCLCLYMHYADAYSETLVEQYTDGAAILGKWEGRSIDFRVLKLWEEKRWKDLATAISSVEEEWQKSGPKSAARAISPSDLSPYTAVIGGILTTRKSQAETTASRFILTPSSRSNLHQLGRCLLESKPILLLGEAGSGKTALIQEAARLLNQSSSIVTLHLNEQTDAKSLLGVYTSSADGESFTWRPGVLTKAIQQGRWVLVEDIDRAPAEVMGVLRPILESGQLFIASRKERIVAADGFRIFATMRASGKGGKMLSARFSWLFSSRLWNTVETANYEPTELDFLLRARYPKAEPFIPTILRVHDAVRRLYGIEPRLKALQSRSPSLRDLLVWSRRVVLRLSADDRNPSSSSIPEAAKVDIFKDAMDAYAGYLNDDELHGVVVSCIAQEMNISPQQMRHSLDEEVTISVGKSSTMLRIGRNNLEKLASRRNTSRSTPFALTRFAQRTLDRISAAVSCSEPCLLVGETGVGKTTLIQHVANLVGHKLTVVNLSQQSEASDLLGGLKPVTTRSLILPLVEKFNALFEDTFSTKRNEKFQMAIMKAVTKQNWPRLTVLWREAIQLASESLNSSSEPSTPNGTGHASKKRKLTTPKYEALRKRWTEFSDSFIQILAQVERGEKNHVFSFVEGRLVQAVREGEWLLLDEINLASPDTLDAIVSLLHSGEDEKPSLLLAEAGKLESIIAHPNFRVFAAMNPATDTGKKDLSPALRSRFTEIYVHSGDNNVEDLAKIVQTYLGALLDIDKRAALDLARAYLDLKKLNHEHRLTDGAGELPHFSIRSLVRCLQYVKKHTANHGLRRAMYEGFAMNFFTVLSRASEALAFAVLEQHLLSNVKNRNSFLTQQPKMPSQADFVAFRHHLVKKGPLNPEPQPHYIRTPSVERNLLNLARAASMRSFPILLQGPTSAGKTSMVEYLCKLSGNKFVRINNHEHTDLQEYLGSYVSGSDGKLQFREGVLVDALRQGHWIVLDELNLAPSDVLEALNRLLDDNRELLVPESQEIVHPHPNFMLFATQNPAGLYGGRKRLSRAFRNRFLELHFDDIPENELEIILRERAQLPPSYCAQIVAVYKKLSLQRQSSRLFEQRNSFATLRDLFRWAARPADDREQLAFHGFMLLAERVRDPAERLVVKKTIEETMKVTIDEAILYNMSVLPTSIKSTDTVVWTSAMRRLFVLVSEALKNNEPVLLVGETGCGKTQICQVVAEAFSRPINIYNAHTNTETGDLIGSQRPIRNRSLLERNVRESWALMFGLSGPETSQENLNIDQLAAQFSTMDKNQYDPELCERVRLNIGAYQALFSWSDGSLVRSMKAGEHFLLDEISLADDSVLERLNSVLEPSRTILLAEKGALDNFVVAHESFQFLATMNPGGDYGKRELSAALRNRLTEIWVPPLSQEEDIIPIVQKRLDDNSSYLAHIMLKFARWFRGTFHTTSSAVIPLRDLLAWAEFIKRMASLGSENALIHGAFMIFIDSIGANPAGMTSISSGDLSMSRTTCLHQLQSLVNIRVRAVYEEIPGLLAKDESLVVGRFSIPRSLHARRVPSDLVFEAPTTLQNTMRIVRALQMRRPILLEGSPGVGKTSIVTALAQASGRAFTRINLSDQTDLMDLFGADAPSENEQMGRFSWRNGPLLDAMQTGGWVLLDEMNLASQSVLEGLNSCLDHRQEAYIAELDKSFSCHPDFTLFAAQNPHHQGGGRKGLPASFVNRFTVVYADSFKQEDLLKICHSKFPAIPIPELETVVATISEMEAVTGQDSTFSHGSPWEFNLRDTSRWLQLCTEQPTLDPLYHFGSIVIERFRTHSQLVRASDIRRAKAPALPAESLYTNVSPVVLQVGTARLDRDIIFQHTIGLHRTLPISQLSAAKSIITAINRNWPLILVGSAGCGKTSLLRSIAAFAGTELVEFSMNADIDTMDLIGGFEQYDARRKVIEIQKKAQETLRLHIAQSVGNQGLVDMQGHLLTLWQTLASPQSKENDLLAALSQLGSLLPRFKDYAIELSDTLMSGADTKSRFVWNDGILVDAIEKGSWLVLDNANLCNPSVLDRLNSLLEPNGSLVISEQHGSVGGGRVIKPHEKFRIFLTVDPRYGELSRAMRNRSLEVYLPTVESRSMELSVIEYPLASAVSRLRSLSKAAGQGQSYEALEANIDNLSVADAGMLQSDEFITPGLEDNDNYAKISIFTQQSDTADDAYKIFGLPKGTREEALPQLLTLNEPWMLLSKPMPQYPVADVITRGWFTIRRMKAVASKLALARERGRIVSTKEQSLMERSLMADNRGKAHTIPMIGVFVEYFMVALQKAVRHEFRRSMDLRLIDSIERVLYFVHSIASLFDSKTLDYSKYYAYIQIGTSMVKVLGAEQNASGLKLLANLFGGALRSLAEHNLFTLRTGFSLQTMWESFRPTVAATGTQLSAQLGVEDLIMQFDRSCQSLNEARKTLSKLRFRLLETYTSIQDYEQPEQSLLALKEAVEALALQAHRGLPIEGKFGEVFDYIYQNVSMGMPSSGLETLVEFQLFSPRARMILPSSDSKPTASTHLRQLASIDPALFSKETSIALRLITSLSAISNQPLGFLSHASEELAELMAITSSHTIAIADKLAPPYLKLQEIFSAIISAHRELLSPAAQNCFMSEGILQLQKFVNIHPGDVSLNTEESAQFTMQYFRHLHPVLLILTDRNGFGPKQLQLALVALSLAALTMMVPEKALDPAVSSSLAVQLHSQRANELTARIQGQRLFQKQISGQDTSLVIRILEDELAWMGDAPPAAKVFRPLKSELLKLQEIFTILSQLLSRDINLSDWVNTETNQQSRANLRSIIERLKNANRAYDDLVKPITWFANCLLLGMEMTLPKPSTARESNIHEIINHTPLLSSIPRDLHQWDISNSRSKTPSLRHHWLDHMALSRRLSQQQGQQASVASVQSIIRILDTFYMEWKSQLVKDQANAVVQSRYYSYRGDEAKQDEQNDQEMLQLFPRYDAESSETDGPGEKYNARDTAIKLAQLHGKLYLPSDTQTATQNYLRSALKKFEHIKDVEDSIVGASFTDLLPAILWHMDNKASEFSARVKPATINIYVDPDVEESRKLFNLVLEIQTRFYIIQERWPEHAVPTEVLAFCNEVLQLTIGEPVAKLTTKTEKLLEIVAQWQSVASREWSVAALVEQLTALIISWRRLELLSWSRLLDDEKVRHEEDALGWFFIAYEAVIYNCIRIQAESDNARSYCINLARTLEDFLRTTPSGQYSSRLALLDSLSRTLHDVAQYDTHLLPLSACVSNVIEHYRRYETNVEVSLQAGRAQLEKALKEQIQLASWKDTNITALRDSARRSHLKLFRIVKKFRVLLSQPVTSFKVSATIALSELRKPQTESQLKSVQPDEIRTPSAIQMCASALPDWTSRPERLTNPFGATQSMQRLYNTTILSLEVQDELASFREDLISNIKELRQETPTSATEDNSSLVRHLQERKRRLFADTLKSLTQMGIRRNLPTSELEKQSSVAVVLASTHSASQSNFFDAATNESFHEMLDIMISARSARQDHSDDLTEGEIARSLGLLEGLLFVSITQRQHLGSTAKELTTLDETCRSIRSLGAHTSVGGLLVSVNFVERSSQLSRHIAWFSELLTLSHQVASFQAKHANLDIPDLLKSLNEYRDIFQDLKSKIDINRELPAGLVDQVTEDLHEQCREQLSTFGDLLQRWLDREPRIEFLLQKLLPWTIWVPSALNGDRQSSSDLSLRDFDQDLRELVDKIFVALQRLPLSSESLPTSIEDPGWLSKSDKYTFQSIHAMHVETIIESSRRLLGSMQHLQPGALEVAVSMFTVASPIIEQYYHIYEHLFQRQVAVHRETCRLTIQLAQAFTTIATEGFCQPSKPTQGDEQSGKLESGTGLGEGEGAEDISKDVGDDEDLSELAQSGEKPDQDGEMETAEDAVDMGNDDLQGENGEQEEQKADDEDGGNQSEDEEHDDMDEETGSVDDLDPSAVDEKMWDDMKKESDSDKELKNDQAKGSKTDDQTAAEGEKAEGENMEQLDGEEDLEQQGDDDDQGESAEAPEAENMDPHPDDEQALDLPEELDLAGGEDEKDGDISDDGMDALSDVEGPADEATLNEDDAGERSANASEDDRDIDQSSAQGEDEEGTALDDEIMEDQPDQMDEDQPETHDTRESDMPHDMEETAGGESGAANELQEEVQQQQNVQGVNQTERETDPQQAQPGTAENEEQGDTGKGATERGAGRIDIIERQQNETLRKLADVLEQFHQRREILPASDEQQPNPEEGAQDVDMADVDFEHVQDENEGDAQALGTAAADQVQNLDQAQAIEDNTIPMDEDTDLHGALEMDDEENVAERFNRLRTQAQDRVQETGAIIPGNTREPFEHLTQLEDAESGSDDLPTDIEHLDINHDQQHPSSPLTSTADAAQLWNHCSTTTHQFSLVLTEQLRLILAPTTATKLRGDFRTGKRLNLKRIIPYIASGYKRDKIWMRRSVPSKRNYQIMIAVDDSKSMAESGADILAFETLALLTKSLSMLEAGELCVVGFGDEEHVRVAHAFGIPFSPSDSGINIFQSFGFQQKGTNVRNLVKESIQLFRDARIKGHTASEDLWQLQLILSDGHCSDHAAISRLVRQAQQEKIIIVFVIVDAGEESILDLKEAVFEQDPTTGSGTVAPEMRVRTKRYLEDFPFPYYLVVRDVRDLPGVLATALKGWFGSVVDVQG